MSPIVANILGILVALLLIQGNVFVLLYLLAQHKAKKDANRYVPIESVADLAALNDALQGRETYQPERYYDDPPA